MKKNILFTCLIAVATMGLYAQSSGTHLASYSTLTPEARAKAATDQLNSTAQLSQDQYTKILKINNDFFAQKPLANGASTPAQLGTNRENQIKAILTAEQLEKVQHANLDAAPKK